MSILETRRRFLTALSLAGAAGLIRTPRALATEGPLETTSVRFMQTPSLCHAPQFVAEELLRAEGFTEVQYIKGASSAEINEAVASGKVDFNTHFAPQWASVIDSGGAVTVLSGVHVGCFQLLRAVLKTADLCVTAPNHIARQLVDGGFTDRYDYALQTLNEALYQWRDFDPEDSLRFYALRLHEEGIIKSSPQKIIADGTDWRFLNELKHELKA